MNEEHPCLATVYRRRWREGVGRWHSAWVGVLTSGVFSTLPKVTSARDRLANLVTFQQVCSGGPVIALERCSPIFAAVGQDVAVAAWWVCGTECGEVEAARTLGIHVNAWMRQRWLGWDAGTVNAGCSSWHDGGLGRRPKPAPLTSPTHWGMLPLTRVGSLLQIAVQIVHAPAVDHPAVARLVVLLHNGALVQLGGGGSCWTERRDGRRRLLFRSCWMPWEFLEVVI